VGHTKSAMNLIVIRSPLATGAPDYYVSGGQALLQPPCRRSAVSIIKVSSTYTRADARGDVP
jgi:hypothetical protein